MKKIKINLEFFTKPAPKIINKLMLAKYGHSNIDLYSNEPCIYVSPNTSRIDKQLITSCINTKFLFINDEIISKIIHGKLQRETIDKILSEIEILSNAGYVFALIWNESPSIFGDNEPISENLCEFLFQTKLDIKFLTFPGLYFNQPVWADNPRKSKIYSHQQINIRHKMLEGFSKKEIVKYFKENTPSSASAYTNKFPVQLLSHNLAMGLERIMYCCPGCSSLCSLYSEFSCIKCRNCGAVYELNSDGKFLFAQNISNFDDIKNYQFSTLKRKGLDINAIAEYKEITQIFEEKNKKIVKITVNFQIFADKLIITNALTNKKTEIIIEDIDYFKYTHRNNLFIKTKNSKLLHFVGNNNENFLIIQDLIKINKN